MSVPTERELVDAAIAGDRGAFGDLVRRYQRLAVAGAVAVLGDRHAAQDVAQDAFVIAYEKLATLRDGASFGAWILQIARRRALRVGRSASRVRSLNPQQAAGIAERNGQLDRASQDLLQHIERLPKHERVAVMLKYFDNRSVADIAHMTGHSVGTVTKQLTRARMRLQTWLQDDER